MESINVFVGTDHVEEIAYHTLCSSIIRYASRPVSITPIKLSHFSSFFQRKRDAKQSNEFSFSRFLVPYLCDYQGWAIFMDCDMVIKGDIAELWDLKREEYAVQVVKHDYVPKEKVKYLGNKQFAYPRKNWSSMMLMNCAKCRGLTLHYVSNASGLALHRFNWLGEDEIGDIPKQWNWLVGEYGLCEDPKLLHYTVGGPWFPEYVDCDYNEQWFEELTYMLHIEGVDKLFDPGIGSHNP